MKWLSTIKSAGEDGTLTLERMELDARHLGAGVPVRGDRDDPRARLSWLLEHDRAHRVLVGELVEDAVQSLAL
jgi:hypothetical protein